MLEQFRNEPDAIETHNHRGFGAGLVVREVFLRDQPRHADVDMAFCNRALGFQHELF